MFIIRNSIGCGQCLCPKMLSDIFSFSFTLLLPNWLLISIKIYSGIARFPCDSMAFLFYDTINQLHWLPVCQRITFKTAVLVYKCRHGMAPPYLSTYCEPTSSLGGRYHLRSAESGQLTVPRTRTNYGDHSFAVHGPVMWNSLPADLRLLNISLPVFRKRLKISCTRITVIVQRPT